MDPRILPYDYDDDLMALAPGTPALRIQPFGHRAVVAGRGSDLAAEIHLSLVSADGIPVYRRKGGGCSVVLDPGNLMVTLAFGAPGIGGIRELFDSCTRWLARRLQDAGIQGVYRAGISDLAVDDRKIAGSCFYRTRGAALFSAAVLVNPDLDLIDRYLAHPPREPGYRRGRSHGAFVAGLNRYYPGVTAAALARELSDGPARLPGHLAA